MYELALFAGAGGGILGGILCGHTCVGAVEIEEYPRQVLLQRQRDGILPEFPIWDDVRTFRTDNPECSEYIEWLHEIKDELVITGGFPCQDISVAGPGHGLDGDRSNLWWEFARIIGEVGPRFVFVENSPAIVVRGGLRVVGSLAEMGYDCRWGVIGSDHAGLVHRRARFWLAADRSGEFGSAWNLLEKSAWKSKRKSRRPSRQTLDQKRWELCQGPFAAPVFCRAADGVADRVDRVRAVGNGQVPAVVELAWDLTSNNS